MKVPKFQSQSNFKSVSSNLVDNSKKCNFSFKSSKNSFTDNFSTKIKNSADLNDCVSVPRSVFKGYLAFMLGTSALTIGTFIPQKANKVKTGLMVAGNLVNLFGIWSFVRPYIIKDAAPTVKGSAILNTAL